MPAFSSAILVSPAAPDLTDDLTDAELAAGLAADAESCCSGACGDRFRSAMDAQEAGDRQANSLLLRRLQAERPE